MKKLISGELLDVRTDEYGVKFYPQNSQKLCAFLSWESAFRAARTGIADQEPEVPKSLHSPLRIVLADEGEGQPK